MIYKYVIFYTNIYQIMSAFRAFISINKIIPSFVKCLIGANRVNLKMTDKNIALLIEDEKLEALADTAKDWAQAHGICMRSKGRLACSDFVEITPFSLVPSRVPKKLFDQAYAVQKDMSLLYHKVSFDYDFIRSSLASVIKNDPFTKRLMDIYDAVHMSGAIFEQQTVLTIQRSDYMFHDPTANDESSQNCTPKIDHLSLKQVEVNNIASSFAALDSNVTDLHKEILRHLQFQDADIEQRLPANRALRTVAEGLARALKHYNVKGAAMLFVVEKINQNVIDQRLIEYEILKIGQAANSAFGVLRLTLEDCFEQLYLSAESRLMVKDSRTEIGVVYFRAGYVPQHYASEDEWRARQLLETSKAIKCPWIGAHLAGTKKIQQMLANPDVLKKYVQDDAARKRIADTFVGLFGLEAGNSSTEAVIAKACSNPKAFVLKPQLEGGGNNFYGVQVKEKLLSMTPEEREAYILMERIDPIVHENIPVRAKQPVCVTKVVSEFGTFGFLLGNKGHVIANESGGHLLRTKSVATDEGGVMAGASVLDSPLSNLSWHFYSKRVCAGFLAPGTMLWAAWLCSEAKRPTTMYSMRINLRTRSASAHAPTVEVPTENR